MSEHKIIGKETVFANYPDALTTALSSNRNTMVESFVDEAVRFYRLMLCYPNFPVEEAMELAMRPDNYKVEVEQVPGSEDWLVSVTEVTE